MMKRANTIKKMSCPGCILTVLYGPDGRRALERDRPRSQQATNCSSAGQNRQSAVLFTFLRPGTVALLWLQCQDADSCPGQSNSGVRLNPVAPRQAGEGETDAARKCAFLHGFPQISGEKGRGGLPRRASPPQFSLRNTMEDKEMRRSQERRPGRR